jgi:hypothetical protein
MAWYLIYMVEGQEHSALGSDYEFQSCWQKTEYAAENFILCMFQGRGFVGHDDGCELHQIVEML